MYTFKQNTKNLCFALIAIGLVAIGYGFYSASASHYSDLEIKEKVKTLYYELKSSNKAQDTASNKTYDSHIDELSSLYMTIWKIGILHQMILMKMGYVII